MDEKQYITQITKEDLRELAAATKPTPGFMIRVENTPGKLKISVDENSLKIGIVALLRNLGMTPFAPTVEQIMNASMNLQ